MTRPTSRASAIFCRRLRHNSPTGKSTETCPALRVKINRWSRANQL
jgi:hypothetical protein